MNLKQFPQKSSGRIYLSIVRSYRDKATGKPRAETIKRLGYLDEFQDKYDDPIAHFREVARQMTEKEKRNRKMTITFDTDENLKSDTDNR